MSDAGETFPCIAIFETCFQDANNSQIISNIIHYGNIIELRHEISNNVVCATSKGSDQPAHMRRLIRAFASSLNILRLLSY